MMIPVPLAKGTSCLVVLRKDPDGRPLKYRPDDDAESEHKELARRGSLT